MHDRVPLDDEGRIGRGPVQRLGGIQGSVISSKGDSASSRRKRPSLIDRSGGKGPTRSNPDDRTHRCSYDNHPPSDSLGSPRVRLARFRFRGSSIASENPMWRPAHPRGVLPRLQSAFTWQPLRLVSIPSLRSGSQSACPKKKANSYGYRCLKRMRAIGGGQVEEDSMDKEARAISRGQTRETIYLPLSEIIWNGWLEYQHAEIMRQIILVLYSPPFVRWLRRAREYELRPI